jgi:hypothetical protein
MNRTGKVIAGCGGMVAVLSGVIDREAKKQILEEVELAQTLNVPYILAVDESVNLPKPVQNKALAVLPVSEADYQTEAGLKQKIHALLLRLQDQWIVPQCAIYFMEPILKEHKNEIIPLALHSKVALMPCQVAQIHQGRFNRKLYVWL